MKRITRYIMALPVFAVLLIMDGCTEDPAGSSNSGYDLTVRTAVHNIEAASTKAETELGKDIIYAYPYSKVNGSFNGTPLVPEAMNGSEYTYKMPEAAQDVVFTNLIDGIGGYTCRTGSTLLSVSLQDNTSGSDCDFVAGTLAESSMDPDQGGLTYPVNLKRKVSRVNIILRSKKKGSDELIPDLSAFFSKVEISVNTYSSYEMKQIIPSGTSGKPDSCSEEYSGEITALWSCSDLPSDDTVSLARYRYIFPSTDDANPVFTLVLTAHNGTVSTLTSKMSQPLLPNRHYNLTLTLRQKSSEFGFEVESFINEDMEVDFDTDDLVPLSVSSSFLVEQMSVQENDGGDGFVLGQDTLWCYSFSTENDELLEGFPKPQKLIYGSNYQYMIPKGKQRLVFSNHKITYNSPYYKAVTLVSDPGDVTSGNYVYSKFGVVHSDMDGNAVCASGRPAFFGFPTNEISDVGDEGIQLSVPLTMVTAGIRIVFKTDDPAVTSFDGWIESAWVSIKRLGQCWSLLDRTSYGSVTYDSERLYASEMKPVVIGGENCLQIMDCKYVFLNSAEGILVDVNLLLKDGTLRAYTTSGTVGSLNKNGVNNIIFENPSEEIKL